MGSRPAAAGQRLIAAVVGADDDPNTVYVPVVVGDLRPTWCDHCLTPTAVTFGVYILAASGPLLVGEGVGCPDCGTGVFAEDDT